MSMQHWKRGTIMTDPFRTKPTLVQNGNILSTGGNFVAGGPLVAAIA